MQSISIPNIVDDVMPHLRKTLFVTGSFCIAWSWNLVFYGASHAIYGENPMREQIGFGGENTSKNRYLAVLLCEYTILVCLAALGSYYTKQRFAETKWCAAALMAIEFLPAPCFSGLVMAYLGQYKSQLGDLGQMGLNLGATAFAALLVHLVHYDGTGSSTGNDTNASTIVYQAVKRFPPQLIRFRTILCESMGFGLGVAWNGFLVQLLAPEQMNSYHVVGLMGYLSVVLLLAFRVAALVQEADETGPQQQQQRHPNHEILQRLYILLSFALNVVCAFTMVAFVQVLVSPPGWLGDGLCVLLLVAMAAILSALVVSVQLDGRQDQGQETEERNCGFGTCWAMDMLVFVPCAWCCCPWIPLLWILAGITPDLHVKEKWYKLIAFVLGLASSIQASGMLTSVLDQISTNSGICGENHCHHPWVFVSLQILLAITETVLLLVLLGNYVITDEDHALEQYEEIPIEDGLPPALQVPTENQSLLKRAKKKLGRYWRK